MLAILYLSPQPKLGPSAHASLRTEHVELVHAAGLPSDRIACDDFSTHLTSQFLTTIIKNDAMLYNYNAVILSYLGSNKGGMLKTIFNRKVGRKISS